jgi:uncharacterized membrane protein SirB2
MNLDNAYALEKHVCPHCGKEHTHKATWDWNKFWIGKLGNKFLSWIVYMVIQFIALLSTKVPAQYTGHIVIVSAIVTVIFMLAGALDIAVSKADIKANLSASVGGIK